MRRGSISLEDAGVTHVRVTLPVRHGTREMRTDFPFREGNVWSVVIGMDDAEIAGWPEDEGLVFLDLEVTDGGIYTLLDESGGEVCTLEEMPVPHGLVPGADGETVEMRIENGVVVNWPLHPDLEDFTEHGMFI